MKRLREQVERGDTDPSFVITHRLPRLDGPRGYQMFVKKEDNCEKVVLKA